MTFTTTKLFLLVLVKCVEEDREAGGGLMNREETDKSCLDSQTGTTECTFPTILLIACIKNDIYVMCKKRQMKVFN